MRILLSLALLAMLAVEALGGPHYRLQPGDRIAVSVWEDPKLADELEIGPDGWISFPLAGQVRAAGLTTAALEAALVGRLNDKFKEPPNVRVKLLGIDGRVARFVFVTGEVRRPDRYEIKKPTTVLQAIAMAGGLDVYAAKKRIRIQRKMRAGDTVIPFNYKAAIRGDIVSENFFLKPGDVVIVPERGLLKGLF